MVNLPFEEDIRTYAFPPLVPRPLAHRGGGGQDLAPAPPQAKAALALVRGMDLGGAPAASGGGGKGGGSGSQQGGGGGGGGGGRVGELLKPEETANPALQRFYRALGRLALGQEEVKGSEDEVGIGQGGWYRGAKTRSLSHHDWGQRTWHTTCWKKIR